MIFGIPLAVYLGIATYLSLVTTASLGIAMHKFHKQVFAYHRFFAILTLTLATIHFVLGFLLWFRGISI